MFSAIGTVLFWMTATAGAAVVASAALLALIGVIALFCRDEQPITKELRGMTYEQRRQWAMREGPYA